MKQLFSMAVLASMLMVSLQVTAQDDKSKRPSPPALATAKLPSGATVSIDYSQPAIKGRVIGKTIEPKDGDVWRTGANEATVFETDKAIQVNDKDLPAGKYALFTLVNDGVWTVIFSKTWKQWGAYDYKMADDALRIKANAEKTPASFSEKLTFTIGADGTVHLLWGDNNVSFSLK
jgi:hypothetical protein